MHMDDANELLEQDWGAALGVDVTIPEPKDAEKVANEMAKGLFL